jgi:hypothetical protein
LAGLSAYEASFYNVGNPSVSTVPADVQHQGGIVIGGGGSGISFDDSVAYTNSGVTDFVSYDAALSAFTVNGGNHVITANRVLVAKSGYGFARFSSGGSLTAKNSIVYNNTKSPGNALTSTSITFSRAFGNSNNSGMTVLNPLTNGMLYLPRIEDGSTLKTLGEAGGQIGPQIVKKMGTSGTLFDDSGFETLTADDLWPWPNEARIKTDFSEIALRGFTATSGSLTDYIWEMLGNPSPL